MGHANRCLDPKQAPGTRLRLEAAGLVILVVPVVLGLGWSAREPGAARSSYDASTRRLRGVARCFGCMMCLGGVLVWFAGLLLRCAAEPRTLRWYGPCADRPPVPQASRRRRGTAARSQA